MFKQTQISILYDDQPQILFAVDAIKSSLFCKGIDIKRVNENADIALTVKPEHTSTKEEGFSIEREGKKIIVSGCDAAGVMYGGLELAEQVTLFDFESIRETTQNPYMRLRGVKFNIPLDMRTPTYTEASDAVQKNIPEMWSFDFWKEYIDNLASHRYNYI